MKNLTETEIKFYDQCETIANYMEEHLYNTVQWQLDLNALGLPDDEEIDEYNEMHAEAMEQVIAIMATRISGLADKIEDYYYYKSNTK
mgnify:FL=1|jgi:hypothetical protein